MYHLQWVSGHTHLIPHFSKSNLHEVSAESDRTPSSIKERQVGVDNVNCQWQFSMI